MCQTSSLGVLQLSAELTDELLQHYGLYKLYDHEDKLYCQVCFFSTGEIFCNVWRVVYLLLMYSQCTCVEGEELTQ